MIDKLLIDLKSAKGDVVAVGEAISGLFDELAPDGHDEHAKVFRAANRLDFSLKLVPGSIRDNEHFAVLCTHTCDGDSRNDTGYNGYLGRLTLIDGMWHAFFLDLYVGSWDNANRAGNEVMIAAFG